MATAPITVGLPDSPVWAPQAHSWNMSVPEQIRVSYARATALAKHVDMTIKDIMELSPKFWKFHSDYVITADSAVSVILTIHWNLCMGTIASYPIGHPALESILRELQQFDPVGEFMLTEVGHGLDARNIETTATLNQDGSFDLHTPVSHAAKVMPPTTPYAGMARLAVVFAQLIVEGEQRSVRPFVARINTADGAMVLGIVSRLLPARPGPKPVDHAVTTFHHVRLEPWALLGGLVGSEDPRKDLFRHIQRVTVGTLSLSLTHIPLLRLMAYIAARTHHQLLDTVFANTDSADIRLRARGLWPADLSVLRQTESAGQIWVSLCFQADRIFCGVTLYNEMIERCGWQGLYGHNQMIEMAMCIRGNSVAEGDKLVPCIRLVSELLLNRYELPKPRNPKGLLAQHEASLWKKASRASKKIMVVTGSNRSEAFNQLLLPQCTNLVKAVGHRMAYEAAEASNTVSTEILELFETSCILQDSSWYVEHKKLTMSRMHKRHAEALKALLPKFDMMLEQTRAAPWVTAPILKEADWDDFIEGLPTFSNKGEIPSVILQEPSTPESEVTLRENSLDSQTVANVLSSKIRQSPEVHNF
ncbi:hypothetical protein FDECE_11332 [Fusarium decemcellulare]|nr:hypothetical protein FDECE_11332 [Fusarium decemcellulare]